MSSQEAITRAVASPITLGQIQPGQEDQQTKERIKIAALNVVKQEEENKDSEEALSMDEVSRKKVMEAFLQGVKVGKSNNPGNNDEFRRFNS
jgi:hypothetical protein